MRTLRKFTIIGSQLLVLIVSMMVNDHLF